MNGGRTSLLAPWIGGASAESFEPIGGCRSMLAFWMGGASGASTEETAVPNVKIVLGHPRKYKTVEQQLHEIRARKKREEEEFQQKIAKAEREREIAHKHVDLALLEEKRKAIVERYMALEAQAQEKIRVLFEERARLIRMMNDEEDVFILLCSLPFMN